MSIEDKAREERLNLLALYVSPLPWFNIDLLHKLYINIFEKYVKKNLDEDGQHSFEIRSITCADLISSSDVIRIDYNAFELEKNKRELLRNKISKEKKAHTEIGQFMVAYSESNHHHFLSPRYREVLDIEGRIIIDPSSAASEITSHISNQINQNSNTNHTAETAEYYLNSLNKQSRNPGIIELKKYLEGTKEWAKGNMEKAIQKFKNLKDKSDSNDKTITVKLPQSIQKAIKANFEKLSEEALLEKLGTGIWLVQLDKKTIGNGILLLGGYLLTANHLIKSIEDAEKTTIIFRNKNISLLSPNPFEHELDPAEFFFTKRDNDFDFTIVKIKDKMSPILSLMGAPVLSVKDIIPGTNVIAVQMIPGRGFKSGKGTILETSETKLYHDILLDKGGSGSPIFDQDGEILAMNIASNRLEGESRVEAIRIDCIKAELNALDMDINNLEAQVKSSDLHCILVGNNEYQANNIYPLRGAVNDASRMRLFIQSNLRYASLKLIQNGSKQEIIQAIDRVNIKLKDGDTLLFYYAGYGGKEYGHFEKLTKFIATNDTFSNQKETNRLSHFELQYLYQQCFDKDIQLVSILDCGYKANPYRSTNEITYYRSLPEVLKKRPKESMIYDEKFRPNEILNNDLISFVVANEDEDVLERVTGGIFMDRFSKIKSSPNLDLTPAKKADLSSEIKNRFLKIQSILNLNPPNPKKANLSFELKRGDINLHQFESVYNAFNYENRKTKQSIEIFTYLDNKRETVLFKKHFLFGSQLVERRIEIAKDNEELDLSGIDLKEVPEFLYKIENLRKLDLSNNKIEGGFSKLLVNEKENIPWNREMKKRLNKILVINVENNPIQSIEDLALLIIICKDVRYSEANLLIKEKQFLEDLKKIVPIHLNRKHLKDYGIIESIRIIAKNVPNIYQIIDLIESKSLQVEQFLQLLKHVYRAYESLPNDKMAEILSIILPRNARILAQQKSVTEETERRRLAQMAAEEGKKILIIQVEQAIREDRIKDALLKLKNYYGLGSSAADLLVRFNELEKNNRLGLINNYRDERNKLLFSISQFIKYL